MLLPLAFNGAPIYWPDSIAYLHGGSTALSTATGLDSRYSDIEKAGLEDTPDASQAPPEVTRADISAASDQEYKISAARSPYYAVLLTGTSLVLGVNAPVYVQAGLVFFSLIFFLKLASGLNQERPALILLCALALTSAGTFATILLPDVLAPLGLLSVALLFGFWGRMSLLEKLFWYLMLILSVVSHSTHLAIVLLLLPFAILLSWYVLKGPVLLPALLVLSAVIVGVLGNVLFGALVERKYGYKPQSFPMIAASLITDGPGRVYLEATCPENGYVYCDHLDTKATEVDTYLWSLDPEFGVYSLASRQTKDKMSEQQWRFLIDTLEYDFIAQFIASLKRMYRQLKDNSLGQFAYSEKMKSELLSLPDIDRRYIKDSAAFHDSFPFGLLGTVSQSVGWVSFVMLLFFVGQALVQQEMTHNSVRDGLIFVSILIVVGFLLNAGLTGAASQPQGRYSARILLLFPILCAIWIGFEMQLKRSSQPDQPTGPG